MKISSTGRVFIPEFNGNRNLEEQSQIKVWCRYLTFGDANSMRMASADEFGYGEKFLRRNIVKIENLEIDGNQVCNGNELCDCEQAPNELVTELAVAAMSYSKLTESEVKN